MSFRVFMALSLVVLVIILPIACTGSEATTTPTTTTQTNPLTTTSTPPPTTSTPPDTTTPTDIFARITCEEVYQTMQSDENWRDYLMSVDARDTIDWDTARLPSAENIPNVLDSPMAIRGRENNLKLLPRDRLLVFYDDTGSPMAVDLAQQLVDLNQELGLGFDLDNIKILEGGINRWLELLYPTSSASG